MMIDAWATALNVLGTEQGQALASKLDMPVLFIAARYDYVCEAVTSNLAAPMRDFCANLTETVIDGGHWLAQERPREVNADLVHWLATRVPQAWPTRR